MSRKWNSSADRSNANDSNSKHIAERAVEKGVAARQNAHTTHRTRFNESYGHTSASPPPHHADGMDGLNDKVAPYTGFDAAVSMASAAPILSPSSRVQLGLVAAGSSVHIGDSSGVQGGSVTGTSVKGWHEVVSNLFNPTRRGPITQFDDDDLVLRHIEVEAGGDSDDESFANGGWDEFEDRTSKGHEPVIVCGEASFNNFRIQSVGAQSEVIVESVEDLIHLLTMPVEGTTAPKSIRHLSLSGAEVPLWALALLFGTQLNHFSKSANDEKTCDSGEQKPAAGSASAAAAAILSFRIPPHAVESVLKTEETRENFAKIVANNLQKRVRAELLSLDLSNGALEARYRSRSNPHPAANANFKLPASVFDPDSATQSKSIRFFEEEPKDVDEAEAERFAQEASISAATMLFRDALQPSRVFSPWQAEAVAGKLQALEAELIKRQARTRREQRRAEQRSEEADGDEYTDALEDIKEAEEGLACADDTLELLTGHEEGATITDDIYEEAIEGLKRDLHKWMDVPPLLENLQALSLHNNPSLFLNPESVGAEGAGSLDTITDPDENALAALKGLLQLSGLNERYAHDYSLCNALRARNEESFVDKGERYIVNALTTLILSKCGLNNATALRYLAEGLKENTSLKKLSLADNKFGQEGDIEVFQEFSDTIGSHKTLEALDLSGNEINGEMCRMLADAIANSFESHKKDEEEEGHDEEDEVEEAGAGGVAVEELFDDVVPAEEEAPNVTIGIPAEETNGDVSEEVIEPVTEEQEEAEEEEEEGEAAGRPPKPRKTSVAESEDENQNDDDVDSEEAAHLREKALKEEERLWRGKFIRYVAKPERILLDHSESVARRVIFSDYLASLISLKKKEIEFAKESKKASKKREDKEAARHKRGWSHLQILSLSSNPIGDDGASAIASMLRHTISLSDDEQQRAQHDREREISKIKRQLMQEKKEELLKAKKEAKALALDEALRKRALAEEVSSAQGSEIRPLIPKLAVPQKGEQSDEDEEFGEEEEEHEDAGENEDHHEEGEEDEEVAIGEDDIAMPVLPQLRDVRPGLRSLHHLNLGDCKIGSKGIRALFSVLADNCKSLRTLNLSKNKFGTRAKPSSADEDGDTIKVDDVDWVSPGVMALSKGLGSNTTLVSLDLSFCRLYPNSIFTLAEALNANRTLKHLNLKGNFIGFPQINQPSPDEGDESMPKPQTCAFAQLLNAFVDETNGPCSLETLILDQNGLGSTPSHTTFNETSATLLATLCHSTLDTLSLACNDLTSTDLATFSNALYALAMDKKTGLSLDGSMSGVGRRSSITDQNEDDATHRAGIPTESANAESESPARMLGDRPSGGIVRAGTSFCVNTSATLRVFNVSDNPKLEGAVAGSAIARVVQFCSRLNHLFIGGCLALGDDGFQVLCIKVGSHPALQVFSGPRIGITSLAPLTAALQAGKVPLIAIDFGDNDIVPSSLTEFTNGISSIATEALAGASPSTQHKRAQSPDSPLPTYGSAPREDCDSDDDDCPPPPFDPNEEDITPAQSFQRQASRMAILAASSSQMNTPTGKNNSKGKAHVLPRYISLWGRRGLVSVLPHLESLAFNGLLEDFFCAQWREADAATHLPKRGSTVPLFHPLQASDSSIGLPVYSQTPSASYFLHRSVFDGAYASALMSLQASLERAVDQEAPPATTEKIAKEITDLKTEIIALYSLLGFHTQEENGLAARQHVFSTPMINTLRHQIMASLVCEMRIELKRANRHLYPGEAVPSLEEDEEGLQVLERIISQNRDRSRAAQRSESLHQRLEKLKILKQLHQHLEGNSQLGEDAESPQTEDGDDSTPVAKGSSSKMYARLIRQAKRNVTEDEVGKSLDSAAAKTNSLTSPARKLNREENNALLSKSRSLTVGGLLLMLVPLLDLGGPSSSFTSAEPTLDTLRRMRWQCLMNRLAIK